MKKLFFLTVMSFLPCIQTMAEDVVQILPTVTFAGAGATEDEQYYLEVQMTNDSYDEVGVVTFDLLLPEGIHFLYEDFEGKRVPFTKKGNSNITYDFSLFEPTLQESGFTRYMLIPGGKFRPITGNSGTFMYMYFEVDADMAPGVYPILIQETIIGRTETEGLYPGLSASYIVVKSSKEADSPLLSVENLDLSAMTGYVPSFVVEKLNEDVATNTNLVSLNLSGATALGAALQVPENSLWYTATQAGLNRTFPANQWSTVCLPFDLSSEQVDAVKASGVEIEQLSSYEGNTVMFESAAEMEANNAYIVRSATAQAPFASLSDVSVDELSPVAVTKDGLTMTGVYEQTVLNSDANTLYYIFNSTDGKFSRVGTNVSVKPFRSYLQRSFNGEAARSLEVTHDDGSTTGIMELPSDKDGASQIVNRKTVNGEWFDLQGRRLSSNVVKGGIRVMQGKKYLDY